jgi:hypothetical protein
MQNIPELLKEAKNIFAFKQTSDDIFNSNLVAIA